MKFYVPVAVAENCHLLEAAFWISIGRVPLPILDDNGNDMRGEIEGLEEYGGRLEGDLFEEGEFDFLEEKIDFDKYFEAATDSPGFRSLQSLQDYIDTVPTLLRNPSNPTQEDIDLIAYVERCNRLIFPLVERAKVKLFNDLMSGDVSATGLKTTKDWEPDWSQDQPKLPERVSVPKEGWNLDGTDWEVSTLVDGPSKYLLVCLSFGEILDRYPSPLIGSTELAGEKFGETMCVTDRSQHHRTSRKLGRGRPPKATGSIRSVVRNVFADKIKRGDVPEKNEALYQEVIQFVETAFNEKISRTTAQSYVKDLLPENRARSARK